MRRHLPALFMVACFLVTGGYAVAQSQGLTVAGPTLPHAHDDRAVSFGNTRAAADVSVSWETLDASDHHLAITVPAAACTILGSDVVDRGISCAAPSLLVCSDDETDVDDCGGVRFNAANQDMQLFSQSGNLVIVPAGGVVEVGDGSRGTRLHSIGSAATYAEIQTNKVSDASSGNILRSDWPLDQSTFSVSPNVGNQIILTASGNYTVDHSHAQTPDPTFFIHSILDPSGVDAEPGNVDDPNDWLSLSHDQTDAIVATGAGGINLQSASGAVTFGDTVGNELVRIDAGATSIAQLILNADVDNASFVLDGNLNQLVFEVGAGAGRQIVITESANRAFDHGHGAPETNPTLIVHSANQSTTEYVSIAHNQTDAVITWAEGHLDLSPTGSSAVVGVGLPTMENSTVAEPIGCTAASVGVTLYVDDTNDSAPGVFCGCIATGDAAGAPNAWDWVRMDDNATACPEF